MSTTLQPSGGDDTAAILDAYLRSRGFKVGLTGVFHYNGPGLDGPAFNFEGDGPGSTTIVLGPSSSFLAPSGRVNDLALQGIQFWGGLGAYHGTFTGVNVGNQYVVDYCRFVAYTGTAVGHCSPDMPYWKVSRSQFQGANSDTTIGVALAGGTDQCSLTDVDFLLNKVGVKAGRGGNNLILDKCDTLQFAAGAGRIHIWIVPSSSWVNAGPGLVVDHHKFGNENMDRSDLRILYAPETPGLDFTTRLPDLNTVSTGHVVGHKVRNSNIVGNTGNGPFVYSTTPNVRACSYGDCDIAGSTPRHVLEYQAPPATDKNRYGPFDWDGGGQVPTTPVCNAPGGYLQAPMGPFVKAA